MQFTNKKDVLDQLGDKLTVGDGCWIWTGSKSQNGYGKIAQNKTTLRAHRVVYELLVGPIPEGLHLDHLCRVRACVRPDHLEPVTARENIHRADRALGRGIAKTHCPRGHPLSGENLVDNGHGRMCRTCRRVQNRIGQARRKAARKALLVTTASAEE